MCLRKFMLKGLIRIFLFISILFTILLFSSSLYSQTNESKSISLNNSLSEVFYLKDWNVKPDTIIYKEQTYDLEIVGVKKNKNSKLYFSVESSILKKIKKQPKKKQPFSVLLNNSLNNVTWKIISDSLLLVELENISNIEKLTIYHKNNLIGAYQIIPFPELTIKINIVPYVIPKWSLDSLKIYLTNYFKSINTNVLFHVLNKESTHVFTKNEKFDNPISSHDRYTGQMTKLRDEFFENHQNASKNEYYLFVIPPFVDSLISSYSIQKGMFNFTSSDKNNNIYKEIISELTRGITGSIVDTSEVIDDSISKISCSTWNLLLKNHDKYLYFDNYEYVRTNSGFLAFYFWEEDQFGNIKLKNNSFLSSVIRPYKKNYPSYYLNITNPFYKILFNVSTKPVNSLHFIFLIISTISVLFYQRKLSKKIGSYKWINRILGLLIFLCFIGLNFFIYQFINLGYRYFQVKNGSIIELNNLSIESAIKKVGYNVNDFSLSEQKSYAELFKKRGNKWIKVRAKNVAYFQGIVNEKKELVRLRYITSSDTLKIHASKPMKAKTHYAILTLKDQFGKLIETKIYNHIGVDLSNKIHLHDPIKRILLFVNGYRPTSLGGDVEQMLLDLEKNGFEYPNSSNLIYPFDRFNYWNPWRSIDDRLKKRINASDVLYADGHFSVSTSNHGSLIDFSMTSGMYPKRCSNSKSHTCYYTNQQNPFSNSLKHFFSKSTRTYDLLAKKPNKKGFKLRYQQGKIAGRNLLLQLNEIPNKSENDTISIVAHSMGYAYSLGMIDVIRNKINFGGFYIIAPENAISGQVYPTEWSQVWQYGSKLTENYPYPPCLQDGVAPQSKVKGLPVANQVFFPKSLYKKQGFFESHFIGNYTWILDIPKGKLGYIKQN